MAGYTFLNKNTNKLWRTVTVACLLLCAGLINAQVPFTSNTEKKQTREGNKQFKKDAYSEAEANYKKALDKKNNMAEPTFNLGDAMYKQKRYEEAEKQFLQSAQNNPDVKIKAKAYHNLGNCYIEQSKWEEAVKAYKNALKHNPNDADTKYNLAYANAKLKEQQQQQQKNNQKNKDQNKDQKDQQDNKDNKENKDNKDQKDNSQQNQQGNKDQQKQGQQPKLTKEEAEKLLKALNNEEQKTNQKVQQKTMKGAVIKIEKDW